MANEKPILESIQKAFPNGLDQNQLWAITKFAKHVRKYARNNSAFNNFANRMFPNATFREVDKIKKGFQCINGQNIPKDIHYKGLRIDVDGVATDQEGETEDA